MTQSTISQLQKLGFKRLDLESLSDSLPEDVWITATEKNLKRQRVSFVFTKKKNEWIGTLNVQNNDTKEIYVLHRITNISLLEVVADMIIFLYQQKMLGPSV